MASSGTGRLYCMVRRRGASVGEDRDGIESNRRSIKHTSTIVGPSIICHMSLQTFQFNIWRSKWAVHSATDVLKLGSMYGNESLDVRRPLCSRQAYHHTPQYAENGSWELEESGTMCKTLRVSTCQTRREKKVLTGPHSRRSCQ